MQQEELQMNKTNNLKLNVWEKTDPILVGDFNEDNRKIDAAVGALTAGAVKFKSGSYIGTNKYGESNPNVLDFGFNPKIVIVYHENSGLGMILMNGMSTQYSSPGNSNFKNYVQWTKTGVQWYNTEYYTYQLNQAETKYFYIAIG